MTALLQEKDRGPAMADRAFAALVFGEAHPYGRSLSGTQAETEALVREDVAAFYATWYRPNNATLIVAGDVTVVGATALAERLFGGWARAALPARAAVVPPAAPTATRIIVVDKPAAAQSSFRIGGVGIKRASADFYPLQVMNTVLGGAFTSRLNNNLRETKGYSYGASSGFSTRRWVGPWTAGGEIVSAKSDSALLEFLKELRGIRATVPAEELTKAKRYLTLGYADRFESTGDVVAGIAGVATLGVPLSELAAYQAKVDAVTAADVRRVAQRYVNPSALTIVIAGDQKSLVPALGALKVAPVEVRDMYGRTVTTP
jgi:predicted Zn-dependent peptidase